MAAATNQIASFGRIAVLADVSVIYATITATATVYATATGGLPIDLTTLLNNLSGAAPFSLPYINPSDVVSIVPIGLTTGGYLPGGFVLGTPTYGAPVYPFTGGSSTAIHPDNSLATCPATIRLYGIGASSSNHAAFGEVADGAVTDSIPVMILVARGGSNIN